MQSSPAMIDEAVVSERCHSLSIGVVLSEAFASPSPSLSASTSTSKNTSQLPPNPSSPSSSSVALSVDYYDPLVEELLAATIANSLIEHYISLARDKYVPACYDYYNNNSNDTTATNGGGERRLVYSPTTPVAAGNTEGGLAFSSAVSSTPPQSQPPHTPSAADTAAKTIGLVAEDTSFKIAIEWTVHHSQKVLLIHTSSNSSPLMREVVCTGDEDAFRRLIDRASRRVFGLLVSMLSGVHSDTLGDAPQKRQREKENEDDEEAEAHHPRSAVLQSLLREKKRRDSSFCFPSGGGHGVRRNVDTESTTHTCTSEDRRSSPCVSSKFDWCAPSVGRIMSDLFSSANGAAGGLKGVRGPLSLGTAISIASFMFPENGGARQIGVRNFSINNMLGDASCSSSSSTKSIHHVAGTIPFACRCVLSVSLSPLVAHERLWGAENENTTTKDLKDLNTKSNGNKTNKNLLSNTTKPKEGGESVGAGDKGGLHVSHRPFGDSGEEGGALNPLTDGHAAFVCRALLMSEGGKALSSSSGGAFSLTPEAETVASSFAARYKATRQLASRYLNNEWLPPIVQSLLATSSASSSSLSFSSLRAMLGSAVHTSPEGKKKKVPLSLLYDFDLMSSGADSGMGEAIADREAELVGYGNDTSKDRPRTAGKKHSRSGDAGKGGSAAPTPNPSSSTVLTPSSARAIFMAEPNGLLLLQEEGDGKVQVGEGEGTTRGESGGTPSLYIVGVDSMYGYLGVELNIYEYDALRREIDRKKRERGGGGGEGDDDADEEGDKRGRRGGADFHEMRAPRTFGVVGRVPIPNLTSAVFDGLKGAEDVCEDEVRDAPEGIIADKNTPQSSLFTGYKTFTSKNRNNRGHLANALHHHYVSESSSSASSTAPPAHIMWINESARPKKASELAIIRWVDGRELFSLVNSAAAAAPVTAASSMTAPSSIVCCSVVIFSWLLRSLVGRRGGGESRLDHGEGDGVLPFLIPIVELEEVHVLSVSRVDNNSPPRPATTKDLCELAEGSAARLIKRTLKRHKHNNNKKDGNVSHSHDDNPNGKELLLSSDSSHHNVVSLGQTRISKLEDCASVYFTEHLLGRNHPHAQWLKRQRKTHNTFVSLLCDRVWHDAQPIKESKILDAAAALTNGWTSTALDSNASSALVTFKSQHKGGSKGAKTDKDSHDHLVEGPCVEFKHKVSEYGSMTQVDTERLRHTITAMASTLGGVIIIGVRDDDGAVVGHVPGAVKEHLRTSAFFPAMAKDAVRVFELKVRPAASATVGGGGGVVGSRAKANNAHSILPPPIPIPSSTAPAAAVSGLAASKGAARSLVGPSSSSSLGLLTGSSSSTSILMARLAKAAASGGGAAAAANNFSINSNSVTASTAVPTGAASSTRVVTIVAVEPSPAPFVLPTLRPFTRHPKVRAGGAGNAALTVGGIVSRLLLFAPDTSEE